MEDSTRCRQPSIPGSASHANLEPIAVRSEPGPFRSSKHGLCTIPRFTHSTVQVGICKRHQQGAEQTDWSWCFEAPR